jgi:hypothetical protein
LNLDFALPGSSDIIHATAELVWRDNEGAAGIRFLDMPSYARKQLMQWLKDQAQEKEKHQRSASAARTGR